MLPVHVACHVHVHVHVHVCMCMSCACGTCLVHVQVHVHVHVQHELSCVIAGAHLQPCAGLYDATHLRHTSALAAWCCKPIP